MRQIAYRQACLFLRKDRCVYRAVCSPDVWVGGLASDAAACFFSAALVYHLRAQR